MRDVVLPTPVSVQRSPSASGAAWAGRSEKLQAHLADAKQSRSNPSLKLAIFLSSLPIHPNNGRMKRRGAVRPGSSGRHPERTEGGQGNEVVPDHPLKKYGPPGREPQSRHKDCLLRELVYN